MNDPMPDDRARLERAAAHYLQSCFRRRTAVRASELSEQLGLAPAYLSRIANALLGEPIRDYLRKKQLAYARRLLKATPLSIEDIALCSGFGTARTFYRAFRKTYEMTPDDYKRQEMSVDRLEPDREDVLRGRRIEEGTPSRVISTVAGHIR